MGWSRRSRFVRSGGQQKEVVDGVDDVLGLNVLVFLITLLRGSQRAIKTHVSDFAEDLFVSLWRFFFIRQIILAYELAPK